MHRTRGTGRAGQSTKKEPIPQTKKHTPKRHNRLHKINTNCFAIWKQKIKFKIIYSKDADDFLNDLPTKIKDKIIYNIAKAKFVIDPELFKKLDDTDIWEFRTFYNKVKYRLLAFWDKDNGTNTLVIATHGFIKKTQKTPPKEIAKAEDIRKAYFNSKK